MFTMAPDRQLYSFDEVAVEMDCEAGRLQHAIDEDRARFPDAMTGFRGVAVDGYRRLAAACGFKGEVAELPGFTGWVLYDDVAREAGRHLKISGVEVADLLASHKLPEAKVECLTDAGRRVVLGLARGVLPEGTEIAKHYAAEMIRRYAGLAALKPPDGVTGPAVARWRDDRRHARFNASVAAAEARNKRGSKPMDRDANRRARRDTAAAAATPAPAAHRTIMPMKSPGR